MRRGGVLQRTFPGRLAAFELLIAAAGARGGDAAALRTVAAELDEAAARYGDEHAGSSYAALADVTRIAALLVEWRAAVQDAVPEADRFRRAARERAALWQAEHRERDGPARLQAIVAAVTTLDAVIEVGPWLGRLAMTPLPVGVFGGDGGGLHVPAGTQAKTEPDPPPELTVAFVSFTVDGEAASATHFLTPREAHDLEIEVRVSRWPDGAERLQLTPVSLEAAGTYDFPPFAFERPRGDPPFVLRRSGRAVILAAQAMRARPFEFRYAAEFAPAGGEQPVAVVGHRTLRIESFDFETSSVTGYPAIDRKLVDIRNNLRGRLPPPVDDLANTMTLLAGVAALAGRSVQDNFFPAPVSEKVFQKVMRDELRRRPEIGVELEEHPAAAGGLTDLSFRGIRLELKVEPANPLRVADCQAYVEQTASYAVGTGKRVGVLCVLDLSPKSASPFPAEDGIDVLTSEHEVAVPTIVLQGALTRPSALSRAARSKRARVP